MEREKVFAIVRYDAYLAHHDAGIELLMRVVKVYLDSDEAESEASRLNALRPDQGSRYWVSAARFVK